MCVIQHSLDGQISHCVNQGLFDAIVRFSAATDGVPKVGGDVEVVCEEPAPSFMGDKPRQDLQSVGPEYRTAAAAALPRTNTPQAGSLESRRRLWTIV